MKNITVNQKMILHPVGQGFFYSFQMEMEIYSNKSKAIYRAVFDCGSLNIKNAREEIKHYHQECLLVNEELDLLIISHFDKDHVNLIGELLKDRKVKKIIAPFLNYEERIILLLKFLITQKKNNRQTDDFYFDLLTDPETALTNYISEDGELIIVTSDPENTPFPIDENDDKDDNDEPTEEKEVYLESITADFKGNIENVNAENSQKSGIFNSTGKVKQMTDSNFPTLKAGETKLVDFMLYRKKIGEDENHFYREVYHNFIGHFFPNHGDNKPSPQELTDVVKALTSSVQIKELFKDAKKALKFKNFNGLDIINPNTTALCLFQFNRKVLNTIKDPYRAHAAMAKIQKFKGIPTRVYQPFINGHQYYYSLQRGPDWRKFIFPNALLTSDSFLLTEDQINEFRNRFQNYWDRIWLFQIPHHGSSKNADDTLLSQLPFHIVPFVNYGINNQWKHPSAQVIDQLISHTYSRNLITINEFSGLEIRFKRLNWLY